MGDYVVTNVFGGPFSPSVAEALVEVEGVDRVAVERYDVARLEGDLLDEDGLARAIDKIRTHKGPALLNSLVAAIERHARNADLPDDLSAVLIEQH